MRGRCLGWRRRRLPASFCCCLQICSQNSGVNHRHRRPRRETGPLASERPSGPVSLWERLACGLAVNSLHSPCAPLLPVWGVDRARHTVPPPPGCLALPSPPHRHPLHARASGSAAAACRGPPDHRLAAPFPLPKPIPLPFPMWHKGLSFPSRPPPFFLSPPWPLQKGGDLRCETHACGGAPPCVPMVTSSSCSSSLHLSRPAPPCSPSCIQLRMPSLGSEILPPPPCFSSRTPGVPTT